MGRKRLRSLLACGGLGLHLLTSPIVMVGLIIGSAQQKAEAYTFPDTIDLTMINQLKALNGQISQQDFQTIVCTSYAASFIGYTDDPCLHLSRLPGFWSETQKLWYKMEGCNGEGVQYKGNYAAITSHPRLQGNYTDANGRLNDTNGNRLVPPSIAASVVICNSPISGLTNPSWFVPSPTGQTTTNILLANQWESSRGRPVNNKTLAFSYWLQRFGPSYVGAELVIPYTTSGTAVENVDYDIFPTGATETPGTFRIAAGRNANNIWTYVLVRGQTVPERTVTYDITVPAGYTLIGRDLTAYLEAVDVPPITITSTTGSNTIQAGASNTGFVLTRNSTNLTQAVDVKYSVSGSATNGTDYNFLDGTVTIPAGQASVTIPIQVDARNGSTAIPQEDIIITVSDGGNFYVEPTAPLTLTIPAYNPGSVSLATSGSNTLTPFTTGGFTVSRAAGADTSQPLTVNYTTSGTAVEGTDYSNLSGSATIRAGQNSIMVPVVIPTSAPQSSTGRTLTVTLADGNGYSASGIAPLNFTLDTTPQVKVIGAETYINPSGFLLTRPSTSDPTQPITLPVTIGGTATGSDYSIPATSGLTSTGTNTYSATIAANRNSLFIPIQEKTGSTSGRTVTATFTPPTGYSTSNGAQPLSFITTGIPVPAKVIGAEASNSPAGFVFVRPSNSDPTQPIAIPFTVGGTATKGTDYTIPTGSGVASTGTNTYTATIPANGQTVFVPVNEQPGSAAGKTVTAAITPPTGYSVSTPSLSVSTTGVPVDPKVIGAETSINPTGFVFVRPANSDPTQAIAIPFTVGGTATKGTDYTIPTGSGVTSTGGNGYSATIPANTQAVFVPVNEQPGSTASKTITAAITPPAGYSISTPSLSVSTTGVPLAPKVIGTGVSTNPSGFVVTRPANADPTQPIAIPFTIGGTATKGTDYEIPATTGVTLSGSGGTVTIPANQSNAFIPVDELPGNSSGKTVTATFTPPTGYTLSNGSQALTYTTAGVEPLPIAPKVIGVNSSANPAGVIFTRPANSDPTQAIAIPFTLDGTATQGADYRIPSGNGVSQSGNGGTATIAPNQQSVFVPIEELSGSQPDKTVAIAPQAPQGYQLSNSQPTVYTTKGIEAPDTTIPLGVGSSNGMIVISRPANGSDLNQPVPLQLSTGGSAQSGLDYKPLPATVEIPAGQTQVVVPIEELRGATVGRTVDLTVTPPAGYSVPNGGAISLPITGMPAVTIQAGVSNNPPAIILNRPVDGSDEPLTVGLEVSGTAKPGVDYQALPGSVTFAAGETQVVIPINELPDATGGLTIGVKPLPPAGYRSTPVTYTTAGTQPAEDQPIADLPEVGVDGKNGNGNTNGSGNQNQNDQVTFTFSRDGGDLSQPLTVRYRVEGNARPGVDYNPADLPGTAVIRANQQSVSVPVRLLGTVESRNGRNLKLVVIPQSGSYTSARMSSSTIALSNRENTTANSNSGDDSNSGGGSGSTAAIVGGVGVAGAGAAALATGGFGGLMTASLSCPANGGIPDQVRQLAQQVDTQAPMEWEHISFNNLPQVNGQPASTQFMAGQMEGIDRLTVKQLQQMGSDISGMTLASLMQEVTLGSLINTIYSGMQVGDIPGMSQMLIDSANQTSQLPTSQLPASGQVAQAIPVAEGLNQIRQMQVGELEDMTLAQLVELFPQLANINWGGMTISQLPGGMDLPISQLVGMDSMTIAQVPGLGDVPFSELFTCLNEQNVLESPNYNATSPNNGN